jgi:hypothetical protein
LRAAARSAPFSFNRCRPIDALGRLFGGILCGLLVKDELPDGLGGSYADPNAAVIVQYAAFVSGPVDNRTSASV